MSKLEYPFIEDEEGRRLHYVMRVADNPKVARTLFILHGQGFSSTPSSFKDEQWNVVCPLDNFGFENGGSWFLGEKGNFFVKNLMLKLIENIKEKTGSTRLYFWGSSMGGYAAIMFGLLCGAEAIFANVPQTRLSHTQYTDNDPFINKCMRCILTENYPYWIDLTLLLADTPKKNYPVFFLTQTRFHPYNYVNEHIYYFIDKCENFGANYFLEVVPKSGHIMYRNIADSIKYFDDYKEDIADWVEKRKFLVDYKNKEIAISKNHANDDMIEIVLKLHSDNNVGNNDLLIRFNFESFDYDDLHSFGLMLSPNTKIGLFRYINTIPKSEYEVKLILPFGIGNHVRFLVEDFYPKGNTKVIGVETRTFAKI